ncbi:Heat shock protein GrpE [Chitinispirillum alkaliphilum]|nr:Heat shock protein GrpE [Chitinispirillum alkaliphilum]
MSSRKDNSAKKEDFSQEQDAEKLQNGSNDGDEKAQNHLREEDQAPAQEVQTEEVEDFKEKYETMNERHLRLMAEFDNFRKRASRDYEKLIDSANERLMSELIEVRENFDRALKTVEINSEECKKFAEGIELIYSRFCEILGKNGLQAFGETGEQFDPQIHDALMKTEHQTIPENHIAEVFEKGYKLKDKVIKHARVIVSSGAPQAQPEE